MPPIVKAAPVVSTVVVLPAPEASPVEVDPVELLSPLPQAARDSVMAAAMVKARNFLLFMSFSPLHLN